jgi:hypothetical protein
VTNGEEFVGVNAEISVPNLEFREWPTGPSASILCGINP